MSEAKWWCIKASNFESTKGTRKLGPFFLVYSLFTIAWMMVSTATLLLSSVSRHRKHGSPVGKINEWVMGTAHLPPPINFWCCQMFASLTERQAWIPIPTSSVCNWLGDSFFWQCPSSWNEVGRGMDVLSRLCPVLTPGSHPEAKQGRGTCRWEGSDRPGLLCPSLHPRWLIFVTLLEQFLRAEECHIGKRNLQQMQMGVILLLPKVICMHECEFLPFPFHSLENIFSLVPS